MIRGAVGAAVAAGEKKGRLVGAAAVEKKTAREGRGRRETKKKKSAAPADRGKEAEQRKSIVRLLIEKWGRFMGYRQTELSPSLSRRRGRLAPSPRVRDRPADIASLSPSIPFASASLSLSLSFCLSSRAYASLARSRRGASLARAALTSSPRTLRPPPFSLAVAASFLLFVFLMDLPRPADRLPAPSGVLFHFFLARRRGESTRARPFFSRRSRH